MSLRHYFYLDRKQLSVLLSTSELTLCERRNRWVPVVVHEVGSVGLKFLPIVFCGRWAAEYVRPWTSFEHITDKTKESNHTSINNQHHTNTLWNKNPYLG